ncbi:MAG: hypothetical protein ACOY3Y_18890, partial [Acidobacteriota bacterium]
MARRAIVMRFSLVAVFTAATGCAAGELFERAPDGELEPDAGSSLISSQKTKAPWWSWWTRRAVDRGAAGAELGLALDSAGKADAAAAKADLGAAAKADLAGATSDQKLPPKPDMTSPSKPDLPPPPKPDQGAPPPVASGPLPTWVALDWSAFPADPGPSYAVAGKVWVVRTTGSDAGAGTDASPLRTIVAALAKAQSGDLVRVHAGSYAEGTPGDWRALVMSKPNVILTAAPGELVTVTPKSTAYKHGVAMLGDNLVLNGINLQGFSPLISLGRDTSAQKKIVISNLTAQATAGAFDGIVSYADNTSKGFAAIDGLLLKNVVVKGAGLSISCNAGPCNSWRLQNVKVEGAGSGSGSGADAIAVESGD